MPYDRFIKLQQYYLDEPFGSQHQTYQTGVLAALINNTNVSSNEHAKAPYDFFESLPQPEKRSAQDPIFILEQMAAFGNPKAIEELDKLRGGN